MNRSTTWAVALSALILSVGAAAGPTEIRVLLGTDPSDEAIHRDQESAQSLTPVLTAILKKPVTMHSTSFLTNVMRATRTRENDVLIGPPIVVASAVSHGYKLIAVNERISSFSLLGAPSVAKIADLKDKRLYLTQQDSTRAYLAKGLLREAKFNLKSLGNLTYGQTSGAGLIALKLNLADATMADDAAIAGWMKDNPGGWHVLATSRKIPSGMAIAVLKSMPVAESDALLRWATSPAGQDIGLGHVRPANAGDVESYRYIASLGILTPQTLPGATVVAADMVSTLMQQGAIAVDTRTETEYKQEHVVDAVFAPYDEKSLKETEFDQTLDGFKAIDLLPHEKSVIFMCNGPECWKSYKASKIAIEHGFKKVYWFRGGVPEWRDRSMPLAHGEDNRESGAQKK